MSLIPSRFFDTDLTSTPFFRFLDELSNYSRDAGELQTFTPRFDIQEHRHSYSLYGELPGVERKDVEIEFSDPQVRPYPTPIFPSPGFPSLQTQFRCLIWKLIFYGIG